jgi:hypothetical protein
MHVSALLLVAALCAPGKSVAAPKPVYFPPTLDATKTEWYSKHLEAMVEPPLWNQKEGSGFRFLWLRTFHHPVAIRVQHLGSSTLLHAIELDGNGGDLPGGKLRHRDMALTAGQWAQLQAQVERAGFWKLTAVQSNMGLDGSQWIVEGYRKSHYHIVDRWTPKDGDFRKLGLLFLRLTGWEFTKGEIY